MVDPRVARPSLFAHQTLDVCYEGAPIRELRQSLYAPSLCVAPSAIFADYDRVIAKLRGEEIRVHGEAVDTHTIRDSCPGKWQESIRKFEPNDMSCDGSDSDSDYAIAEDYDAVDVDEYHQKPQRGHNVYVALDISNTYASPIRKRFFVRESLKSMPYASGRRSVMSSSDDSEAEARAPARCPYVSPEDGARCRKINKTPQEGGRHWRSCHLYKEAKEMLTGVLPVGQGTAITSEAQLSEVTPLIQCPFCSALITRSDAMRRHLRTNCKAIS